MNRETAHRHAAAGLPVFPADSETKRPRIRFTSAATRIARGVNYFWSCHGADALPCINLSGCGLVVVDLDRGHNELIDGIASFDALLDANGELPACPAVRTPRGGVHLYFRQPREGEPIRNSAGHIGPGIDVRGIGGFTVAPGAIISTGEFYEAIAGTPELCEAFRAGAVPEIPAWLADLARKPAFDAPERGPNTTSIADGRMRAFALAVLQGEAAELAAIVEGRRNEKLNDAAFLAASKGGAHNAITEGEAWDSLWSACVANGYIGSKKPGDGPEGFKKTFFSGWSDGLMKPSAGPRERINSDPAFAARISGLK